MKQLYCVFIKTGLIQMWWYVVWWTTLSNGQLNSRNGLDVFLYAAVCNSRRGERDSGHCTVSDGYCSFVFLLFWLDRWMKVMHDPFFVPWKQLLLHTQHTCIHTSIYMDTHIHTHIHIHGYIHTHMCPLHTLARFQVFFPLDPFNQWTMWETLILKLKVKLFNVRNTWWRL